MSQEIQPALSELVATQSVLEMMKNDLDLASYGIVEDNQTLTKMRAVHNAARGLHDIIRTFPTARRAA